MGTRFAFERVRKSLRQGYVRLLQSPGAPREVAGGMALGLFIAMLPIMGLQMPVAVAVAELIRRIVGLRLSRVAAAAGVWLTNPLTAAPIYSACYLVGLPLARLIVPRAGVRPPSAEAADAIVAATENVAAAPAAAGPFALQLVVALFVGGAILGLPVSVAGYRITHTLVARYQRRRSERRARGKSRDRYGGIVTSI